MADKTLRLGVAGLGQGFTKMLPALSHHPNIDVVAAADIRPEALERFKSDFGGTSHLSVESMCAEADIDVVYVTTPHEFHAAHAIISAQAGKHILVEKPMAVTIAECTRMIDCAKSAGVLLLVGHSHSYDAPILKTRRLIQSGDYGPPKLITGLNYTDFIYRPRRPEELDTAKGGGVVFSQGAHQVDITRLLGGGEVETVYATTGDFDISRSTEGAYSALLKFANGTVANLTYSGYAHFDTDEFNGWRTESGAAKDPENYGSSRRALSDPFEDTRTEAAIKADRAYGGRAGAVRSDLRRPDHQHEHFGLFIVSCPRADIRPLPNGVRVYRHTDIDFHPLPNPFIPRAEVIDELYAAVNDGVPPIHTGEWGRATLEVCCAIIQSANEGREILLNHQVTPGDVEK
ncbi:MAG: putative 4,5-dihydroxyphthalate dehydrogenase [Alphaproteobacteria bacterium MarineAlpha11_Bin1]|nr:MAG: putative 4,5-dihydroxyphthalate dehydrogenase [Alphaproteobacteria bacterium MarineAlpha11_Bin1]|tara:strand:- start:3194 stop:4402 length:1209 start_codon:yes stop_codon:yes gene_type:complete